MLETSGNVIRLYIGLGGVIRERFLERFVERFWIVFGEIVITFVQERSYVNISAKPS